MLGFRAAVVGALVGMLAIAGCSGPTPTASPGPTVPLPAGGPSSPPAEAPAPPSLPSPPSGDPASSESVPSSPPGTADQPNPDPAANHADPSLESALPTDVGGIQLTTSSLTGHQYLTLFPEHDAFASFLSGVGSSPGEASVAVAYDPTWTVQGSITALSVPGLPDQELTEAVLALQREQLGPSVVVEELIVAGKPVHALTFSGATAYLHVSDGVAFLINGEETARSSLMEALA